MQGRYFPKRVKTRAYDTRAILSLQGENEGVGHKGDTFLKGWKRGLGHNARSVLS